MLIDQLSEAQHSILSLRSSAPRRMRVRERSWSRLRSRDHTQCRDYYIRSLVGDFFGNRIPCLSRYCNRRSEVWFFQLASDSLMLSFISFSPLYLLRAAKNDFFFQVWGLTKHTWSIGYTCFHDDPKISRSLTSSQDRLILRLNLRIGSKRSFSNPRSAKMSVESFLGDD
jgi:hypothetical protein